MPERQFITGIAGVQVNDVRQGVDKFEVIGRAIISPETHCPRCFKKEFRIKATTERRIKHGLLGRKLVWLLLQISKLFCKNCGRYFTQSIPGLLPKKRATEQFRQEVFHLHQGGLTQTYLSQSHAISSSTVERWYHDFVEYRVRELAGRECPSMLGIDEHFFSRKNGFATTFVDLRNHKVFDVVLGRFESDLKAFLQQLPGREKVKVVCIDLSENYRRIIKKYFPNALIVTDRFHVIRWVNHQFLNAWKQLEPTGRKERSILGLMRRHEWNLSVDKSVELANYFSQHPEIKAIYDFKQGLVELLLNKHVTAKKAKSLIPQFLWYIEECLKSPIQAFQELGKTLRRWQEPIARMWRFSKSNGITEGLHNKMEMLSRRAFGFRNFLNYRLRVIALCGWDGVFSIRN